MDKNQAQLVEGTEVFIISEKRMGNVFALNGDTVTVVLRATETERMAMCEYPLTDLQYFVK